MTSYADLEDTTYLNVLLRDVYEEQLVGRPEVLVRAMCNLSSIVARHAPDDEVQFPTVPADCICPDTLKRKMEMGEEYPGLVGDGIDTYWRHGGLTYAWIVKVVLRELGVTDLPDFSDEAGDT